MIDRTIESAVVIQRNDGLFSCSEPGCDATYSRVGDCRRHVKKHNGPFFNCGQDDCRMRFYRGDKLREHTKNAHGVLIPTGSLRRQITDNSDDIITQQSHPQPSSQGKMTLQASENEPRPKISKEGKMYELDSSRTNVLDRGNEVLDDSVAAHPNYPHCRDTSEDEVTGPHASQNMAPSSLTAQEIGRARISPADIDFPHTTSSSASDQEHTAPKSGDRIDGEIEHSERNEMLRIEQVRTEMQAHTLKMINDLNDAKNSFIKGVGLSVKAAANAREVDLPTSPSGQRSLQPTGGDANETEAIDQIGSQYPAIGTMSNSRITLSDDSKDKWRRVTNKLLPALLELVPQDKRLDNPFKLKLQVFGLDQETAKPYVIIYCPPQTVESVMELIQTEPILELCEATLDSPKFEVVVVADLKQQTALGLDQTSTMSVEKSLNKTTQSQRSMVETEADKIQAQIYLEEIASGLNNLTKDFVLERPSRNTDPPSPEHTHGRLQETKQADPDGVSEKRGFESESFELTFESMMAWRPRIRDMCVTLEGKKRLTERGERLKRLLMNVDSGLNDLERQAGGVLVTSQDRVTDIDLSEFRTLLFNFVTSSSKFDPLIEIDESKPVQQQFLTQEERSEKLGALEYYLLLATKVIERSTADRHAVSNQITLTDPNAETRESHQETEYLQLSDWEAESDCASIFSLAESVFSIASLDSAATGISTGSSYNAVQIETATAELLNIFLGDENLATFYRTAINLPSVGPERLQRNLRRLLKKFAYDLSAEADQELERLSARLVSWKAAYVARYIIERFQVKRVVTTAILPEPLQKMPSTDDVSDNEDDLEEGEERVEDVVDEDLIEDLSAFRRFLVEGRAFAGFQDQLKTFVTPRLPAARNLTATQDLTDDNLPPDTAEATKRESVGGTVRPQEGNNLLAGLGRLMQDLFIVAGYLESPLHPGLFRLRWQCVSAIHLTLAPDVQADLFPEMRRTVLL